MQIENDYQALVLALKLTVTAPTAAKAQECVEMAKSFAASLSSEQIQRAKRETSQ